MTIVAGVSSVFDTVVLADCRLSYPSPTGVLLKRDVCQKLVGANGWSVVGFAGQLCIARHLLNGIVNRLRDTDPQRPDWLQNDESLKEFVANGRSNHAARWGPGHEACQDAKARLLIAWMDYSRSIFAPGPGANDAPFVPGTEIVVVRSPELDVRRTRLGLDIIGTPSIAPAMRNEAFNLLLHFAHGSEHGLVHRALMATQVVRDLLADRGGVPAVGGLFQAVTLSTKGVEPLSYFYLAPVEPGYRTYVAMRFEAGEWVQEHRPSGMKLPVVSPFAIDPFTSPGQHEMFDPALALNRDSPGVVPQQGMETVFWLYDPANVSPAIRASWGEEPLAPQSWSVPPSEAD